MITKRSTKQILADSLLDLLQNKPIDKISVQEIALNCNVSPRSFYNHFIDKHDLVGWIYLEKERELFHEFISKNSLYDAFLQLCIFTYDNRIVFRNLMQYTGQNNLSEQVITQAKCTFAEAIMKNENLNCLDFHTSFAIEFWINGVISMIDKWLNSRFPLSPTDFFDQVIFSTPERLKPYVTPNDIKK